MKKIAIVSDIHANKYALNVFLEFINKQNIDIILNLGDFVQIGPNPYEVSSIVLNDKKFINILGNNETSLFDINSDMGNEEMSHRIWTKENLKENFEKIKNIPTKKIIEMENIRFLLIHSRKNNINDMPVIYSSNIDEFAKDYETFKVDIILFGHTHEKMYIEHNNKLFINPGSLGCSRVRMVDFAILELDDGKVINCEFKSLNYNKNELLLDFENQNVPDKNFITRTFFSD